MKYITRLKRATRRLALSGALVAVGLTSTTSLSFSAGAQLGLPLAPAQGSAASLNVPPNATAEQLRDASLRELGWSEAALAYVSEPRADGRARILLTYLPNQQADCKGDWTCFTGFFPGVDRVQISIDPASALFARGFTHEYGHALDTARGYSDSSAGNVLYDLLELSQDADHPEARWAARQILQLREDDSGRVDTLGYRAMLDRSDFSHLSIALLEFGTGNDAAKLPDWFRQAYYPYLQPSTPRLARPVRIPLDHVPSDIAARVQRVVDLIAQYCGPILAGARTQAATTCAAHTRPWPDVPYAPYPGANATGPAAPGVPHAPIVDAIPVQLVVTPAKPPPSAPVVSHTADQGLISIRPQTPAVTQPVPADVPAAVPAQFTLPLTQPGQSPDEGTILTPAEAIGSAYYFIATGQRFSLTEAEVQAVLAANPLQPFFSAPTERIAQYLEALPPGQGQPGLLVLQDQPQPDADAAVDE